MGTVPPKSRRIESNLSVRLAKPLFLIAESDLNDPRLLFSKGMGGFGIDAVWNDDFHHALHVVLTGGLYSDFQGIRDLARALERGFVYEGQFSRFRNCHHGQPLGNLSLRRLVGYSQVTLEPESGALCVNASDENEPR